MRSETRRLLGFAAGSLCGGATLGGIGFYVFVFPNNSLVWSLLFIVAFIAAVFGFVAPLALFLFVGSFSKTPSLFRATGYLLSVVGSISLVVFGTQFLGDIGVDTPMAALALFDAAIGWTIGGIAGLKLSQPSKQNSLQ